MPTGHLRQDHPIAGLWGDGFIVVIPTESMLLNFNFALDGLGRNTLDAARDGGVMTRGS
jgi:hypothetical protein